MTERRASNGPTIELSIVIPVFNEGGSIADVIRGIERAVVSPHETLVVYDFDEDNTVPIVQMMLGEFPAVSLLKNDLGRGVLNAIRAGIANSKGSLVLVTMADGSDDPDDIEAMLDRARSGAAVVAASRYVGAGRQIGGPALKAATSKMAGWLLHHFGGVDTFDPTNNYKLYRRDYLNTVTIESTRGFELALELTVKAVSQGLVIAEVPTVWQDRSFGESKWDIHLLPGYLRWFSFAMAQRLPGLLREPVVKFCSPATRSGT